MFAVVQIGSSQYIVREKEEFLVDCLSAEEGKNLMLDQVLLYAEDGGKRVELGKPYLSNVSVEVRVMGEEKGEKIMVFKMKSKKRYRRTKGHRSLYTRLKVLKISMLSGAGKKKDVAEPVAEEIALTPEKSIVKPVAKKAPAKKSVAKKTTKKPKDPLKVEAKA